MEEIKAIPAKTHLDDRGFLVHIFENGEGFFPEVKRIYVVGNFGKGVIRGLHMHREERKLFFVAKGAAKFVAFKEEEKDARVIVLSERSPSVLIVPPSYYHGWVSLEEDTILVAASDKTLEESLKDDIRVDPCKFGDFWKVEPR